MRGRMLAEIARVVAEPLVHQAEIDAIMANPSPAMDTFLVLLLLEREATLAELMLLAKRRDQIIKQQSRMYFVRPDLHWPDNCAWTHVDAVHSTMAMLNLTRLDWRTFDLLLTYADRDWVAWRDGWMNATRTVRRPGRPHNLSARSCFALALTHLSTSAEAKYLELIFGCTHSDVSRDLEDGLTHLLEALQQCPEAEVAWPEAEDFEEYADLVNSEENMGAPPLGCRGALFTDCLRLTMENMADAERQNQYYNRWTKVEGINNLFTFAPDGRIVHAVLNVPGKTHDMAIAQCTLVPLLRDPDMTPAGFSSYGDVGFYSLATDELIVTGYYHSGEDWEVSARRRRRHERWMRAVRQPAEWGMRILRGTWRRITAPLPTNDAKRLRLLQCAVHLHNLVASCVEGGHNQIRSVYTNFALHA
jgi:hypothetical protein